MKKLILKAKYFWHKHELNKTLSVVMQHILSALVGMAITMIISNDWSITIAVLIIYFVISILQIVLSYISNNSVSIISIMNKNIKNHRYEEAINYGSVIAPLLSNSYLNFERIRIAELMILCCEKMKNLNRSETVYIDGKSIDEIRISLLIEDLGWQLNLIGKTRESIENIHNGILAANKAAKYLYSIDKEKNYSEIKSLVSLMLRGFRHITGICYDNDFYINHAELYENISKVIISNGRIFNNNGICINRNAFNSCDIPGKICFCENETLISKCLLNEFVLNYFDFSVNNQNEENFEIKCRKYLNNKTDISIDYGDIQSMMVLFDYLKIDDKFKLIKEISYGWGRNNIKKINFIEKNKIVNKRYVSDFEVKCLINEAKSYLLVHIYGIELINKDNVDLMLNTDCLQILKDFKKDTNNKILLRIISLFNEIDISVLSINPGSGINLHKNIDLLESNIEETIKISRDLRTDIYVRNLIYLMKVKLIRYLNDNYFPYQSITTENNPDNVIKEITNIFNEIPKYINNFSNLSKIYNDYVDIIKKCIIIKNKKFKIIKNAKLDNMINDFLLNNDTLTNFKLEDELYLSSENLNEEVNKIKKYWSVL